MDASLPTTVAAVVVGAGPAGLAASVALAERGIDHVVLERDDVGQSWRTKRWELLRLNNPGWMNPMLGTQDPHTYLRGADVVRRLERIAGHAPVLTGVEVREVARRDGRWRVRTSAGELMARDVVAATGGENLPRIPPLARAAARRRAALRGRVPQPPAAARRRRAGGG
ncbi:NAD(P)-binding domain-containing protein [Georgenia sp. AZ-5]|uniref:NAD(P)-binding domain-containing protein n=1 Tax=Georgenia sp. AZ-5 TaxID=3367526 RepID=UPI003754AB07